MPRGVNSAPASERRSAWSLPLELRGGYDRRLMDLQVPPPPGALVQCVTLVDG